MMGAGRTRSPLQARVRADAVESVLPDGTACRALTSRQVRKIAEDLGVGPREVEIAALSDGVLPLRYARNMRTFSFDEQVRLLNASACVVGLGGLGGVVSEVLSRMGVGRVALVDGDVFEDSNLNRQLLSLEDVLGRPKARVAAERVRAVNAAVSVTVHEAFLTPENSAGILEGMDVVADCLDNLQTRLLLEKAARAAQIPLVSAAVAGMSGQITTVYPEDPGLAALYGDAADLPEKGAETQLGCPPPIVLMLGTLESLEIVNVLAGRKAQWRNRLFAVDLEDGFFEAMDLLA